jgi:hypothetical protein
MVFGRQEGLRQSAVLASAHAESPFRDDRAVERERKRARIAGGLPDLRSSVF